jgi:hypothetical protein
VRAIDAATSALAHYDKIISQRIFDQALAECTKLAAHAQRVMTALSVVMAAWQHQEDTVHAQALAKKALAKEQRHHETAAQEKALADKANERRQAAARETVLTDKAHERHQAAVWENALANQANKLCRQESAECAAATAKKALADETHEQRRTAKHATTLAVTVLTKLKAAPKVRYGGPPPTHFSSPLTAAEVAELDAAILDKRRRHETAAR